MLLSCPCTGEDMASRPQPGGIILGRKRGWVFQLTELEFPCFMCFMPGTKRPDAQRHIAVLRVVIPLSSRRGNTGGVFAVRAPRARLL